MAAAAAERGKLAAQRAALEPWLALDAPLDLTDTREVSFVYGSVPARTDREALTAAMAECTELCQLQWAGKDGDGQYLLLICHKRAEEAVMELLKSYGFTRASLRGWTGTARENVDALGAEMARLDGVRTEAEAAIAQEAGNRNALTLCIDRMTQDIQREEGKERLLRSDATFYLDGWAPAEAQETVDRVLSRYTLAWEWADPAPEEYPQVPVKLKNNRLTRSMNVITEMYSLPAYDGVDPNPLMFPFFVLFFGMMLADMGYGLLMVIASLVFLKKARPKNGAFMEMILWCGISTLIWGALTGGFFGDFIPQLLRILNPDSTFTMPALFTPLDDTIAILGGSLVLGAIQVFTGMVVSVVGKIRAGDFVDALFDEITWWIILAGVALAILGIGSVGGFPVVLIAGGLMLAVGGTRKAKGFGKVASLVGLVYNGVSGFFSDILSYLRLMALMLAGSVIAQVFNTLGAVFGNVVVFVIISMIGNALNLALNLLGCYVHDLRLQCLEFFNRFYKEGGRPFRPLTIDTKYVDVQSTDLG